MLLGDFFEISDVINAENGSIDASVKINKDHSIFNGHFPDFPIVPGVCMIQMVKEIISSLQQSSLMFVRGDNIKFLQFINPNMFETVTVNILNKFNDDDSLSAVAKIYSGDTVFLKLKGVFQKSR